MDKDLQIQSLKKHTNTRLIPTADLPPRIKTPNIVTMKRIPDPSMSASGSFKNLRPASLHGSNMR